MGKQQECVVLARRVSKILIVDDTPHNIDVLSATLAGEQCELMAATSGARALELAVRGHPDLVLLDVMMPGMDGFEVCRRLKADPQTAELPVIAVSASSLEHERRFYIEHGFQDFIGKPYPFQDVYRALVRHAGVRLHPAQEPAAPEAALPVPLPSGLGAPVRAQLRELIAAAAGGQLAQVGKLMATLRPETIGGERWRSFDEAAQTYDFQLLEQRARELLALAEAAESAADGH